MTLRVAIGLALAATLAASGCITHVPRALPRTNPEARRDPEPDTSCPPGEVRVYRPSRKSKSPADAAIPPAYDTPSRAESHCARPY
ncbi:MAG: hypothetical protein GC155_10730 [Alphaproteobacteria bacterium]|nr:hypothetical protein [Alphaproteobacteria bacterium]